MKNEISAHHMKQDGSCQSHGAQEIILWPLKGQGLMREFRIEPGLTTRTWDCSFRNEVELNEELQVPGADCVIAYFPDEINLQLHNGNQSWCKNGSWNMLFVRRCALRLVLYPLTRYRCMSIHFSLAWFRKNSSRVFELCGLNSSMGKGVVRLDSVNSQELELINDVLGNCWKKTMGLLYIKSLVFQLVSNFCNRIHNAEEGDSFSCSGGDVIEAIEQTILKNIGGTLPALKEIASRFSISESSLKRKFREKHGESISTHFLKKKIAHAKFLIEQKNYSISAASRAVGFKSNYHFMLKYKKYCDMFSPGVESNLSQNAK